MFTPPIWGGDSDDQGYGIAVDNSGCAYVTGFTWSSDFPTLNKYQDYQGGSDVFVTKINTTKSGIASLVYSTCLGGSDYGYEAGYDIVVDSSGCVYVTGYTETTDFPTLNQYQNSIKSEDAFVTKLKFTATGSINYQVTTSVTGGHGAVNPLSQMVKKGSNASIIITPDLGYEIASILDNGTSQPIANPYIIAKVTSDHTVVVTFKPAVILNLSAMRKTEKAWIIKRDYAEVIMSVTNSSSIVSGFKLFRKTNDAAFEMILEMSASQLASGSLAYNDKFIDKDKTYMYKFSAYDSSGNLITESNAVTLDAGNSQPQTIFFHSNAKPQIQARRGNKFE